MRPCIAETPLYAPPLSGCSFVGFGRAYTCLTCKHVQHTYVARMSHMQCRVRECRTVATEKVQRNSGVRFPTCKLFGFSCTSMGGVWSGACDEGWRRSAQGRSGKRLLFYRVLGSASGRLGIKRDWDWQGRSRWSAYAGPCSHAILVPGGFPLVSPCVTLCSLFG